MQLIRSLLAPPIPIFGGGDVYSSEAYWDSMEKYGVDGIMIARGALIKPWILCVLLFSFIGQFSSLDYSTEIKERREWDISSRERLELIRKVNLLCFFSALEFTFPFLQYAEFGLKCVRTVR
jgi:tRNA-dihydrouridine synthase